MILERFLKPNRSMMLKTATTTCTPSPAPARSCSPAMSEISVGSPSPPPPSSTTMRFSTATKSGLQLTPLTVLCATPPAASCQAPLPLKRIRLSSSSSHTRPATPPALQNAFKSNSTATKSTAERVKSFSIADILGKNEEPQKSSSPTTTHKERQEVLAAPRPPTHPQPLLVPPLIPVLSSIPPSANLKPTCLGPIPLRPFISPAHLLHYEQRLAWDYQRQLQEHFQVQAQLLRQMSMDPNVIQSEDGSERDSHSSSTGSACCSPVVNVDANDDVVDDEHEVNEGSGVKNKLTLRNETSKKSSSNHADTPLDALFQLSTKNFDEEQDPATLKIFETRTNPKKKRKSRTAFTNHQIFELEKRFLYQKYLSPADRDEIAAGLGLSNAQVITWFQNRRAKLKRDMEELKKDVESVKQLSAHKSFLENVNDLNILKTRPASRQQQHQGSSSTAPAATGLPQPPPSSPQQQQLSIQIYNHSDKPQFPTFVAMASPATTNSSSSNHSAAQENSSNQQQPQQQPRLQQHNHRG